MDGCKGTRHLVRGLGAAGLGHVDADEDEVPGLLVVVVPALEPGVVGHPVAGRAHAAAAHLVIGCDVITVGADKNGTPIFVHFSVQAASISISSVAIIKRRS